MISSTRFAGEMMKTLRTVIVWPMPVPWRNVVGSSMPNSIATLRSLSAMIGKFTRVFCVSLMSAIQRSWSSALSTLRPMTLAFLARHSGSSFAVAPNSVVQTGVKSAGCENSTHHESPMNWWKLIGPRLVSASKSGTLSPMRM